MKITFSTTTVILLVLVSAAHAQTPRQSTDARWTTWLGCWQLLDDTQRDANPDATQLRGTQGVARPVNDVSVCVTPAGDSAAVSLNTRVRNQPAFEQTIAADGADHLVTDAGCRGTQRAEWSAAGTMLFVTADVTCDDQTPRKTSGLAVMTRGGIWVDVQAIDIAGREGIRVRRYRRAPDQAGSAIAPRFGAPLTLDEVKEASGKVAAGAVEAVLIATNARFELSSRRLIDLSDSGVRQNVIDLMIALSYPERFTVERASAGTIGSFVDPYSTGPFPYSPYFYAPLMYGYSTYLFDDYYYSPSVYWYSGRDGLLYVPGGGFVMLDNGASGSKSQDDDHSGRVINGVGYARVRPRETSGDETPGRARQDGSSGVMSAGADSSPSSSGASSGGATTSGGYSSGSSSGDTGRTAQPR